MTAEKSGETEYKKEIDTCEVNIYPENVTVKEKIPC